MSIPASEAGKVLTDPEDQDDTVRGAIVH